MIRWVSVLMSFAIPVATLSVRSAQPWLSRAILQAPRALAGSGNFFLQSFGYQRLINLLPCDVESRRHIENQEVFDLAQVEQDHLDL